MDGNSEQLLTADEAAAYLGFSKKWVYERARAGEIPHKRIGASVRFRKSELDAWVEGHTAVAVEREDPHPDEAA